MRRRWRSWRARRRLRQERYLWGGTEPRRTPADDALDEFAAQPRPPWEHVRRSLLLGVLPQAPTGIEHPNGQPRLPD